MDYQSKYAGRVMDNKFDAIGLHVVAGRRIPKSNFGPIGTVRYSLRPTFICDAEELETAIDAPVLVALLESGIIKPDRECEIINGKAVFHERIVRFSYVKPGFNGIKKTATGYELMKIQYAKTFSPFLEIQNGRIVCTKKVQVTWNYSKFPDDDSSVSFSSSFLFAYRKSGKKSRRHGEKENPIINNKRKKWLISSIRKDGSTLRKWKRAIYRSGDYGYRNGHLFRDGVALKIAGGLFYVGGSAAAVRLKGRAIAIHRNRWRSERFTEVDFCRTQNK